jgi:hypothetical protein
MSTGEDIRRIALSLEGTTDAPHFDRTAFRAKRIYVTLAADEKTASFVHPGTTGVQMHDGAKSLWAHAQCLVQARRHDRHPF